MSPKVVTAPLGLSFSNNKAGIIILALLTSWGYCKGHIVTPILSRLLDTEIPRVNLFKFLLMPPRTLCIVLSTWNTSINGLVVERITWKS